MSRLFPEVEEGDAPNTVPRAEAVVPGGAHRPVGAPSPATVAMQSGSPEDPPKFMQARATQRVLALFDRVFGLPGRFRNAESECHVRAVNLAEDTRIEFAVSGGGVPESTFFILDGASEGAIERTKHVSLVCKGKSVPPVVQTLVKQVAHRIQDGTFALLARPLVAAIPKDEAQPPQPSAAAAPPPSDGLPMPHMSWPPTDVDEEYLNSLGFGYSPPGAWRNFLQGHENNYGGMENTRGYCQRMSGHVVNVNHTEIECYYSAPERGNGSVAFWNHAAPMFNPADVETVTDLFSDLSDMDVIKGGTTKLDQMFDALVASGHRPDMVVMTSTCTTTVIGDDTVGSAERLKKKSPLRVLNMHESRDVRELLFEEIRARPGFASVPKRPKAVNIVGMPRLRGHESLFEILQESGVAVNAWVLPEVNMQQLERYMAAELQVFYDWAFLDRSYKTLFGPLSLPSIRPPPPYGIEGTRRWLAAIADALGEPTLFESAWSRRIAKLQPKWDALVRTARGYRLGFVGEEKTLQGFFDTRQILGIPILPLLEEMGFGIDLYLIRTKGSPPPSAVLEDGQRRTRYFTSPEELEELLREGDTAAFYSELYFDRRLTRTGKNSFSIAEFGRIGLEGSLESLRLLVASCKLPFFRTYGAFMGEPFATGRPPAPPGESNG